STTRARRAGSHRRTADPAVMDSPREFVVHWPPQPHDHAIAMLTLFVLEEENGGTRVTGTEKGGAALTDDIRRQSGSTAPPGRYNGPGDSKSAPGGRITCNRQLP